MFWFSKKETRVIFSILLIIILISLVNFRVSLRASRDVQRKNDIRAISDALNTFSSDLGGYPLGSAQGKIIACSDETAEKIFDDKTGEMIVVLKACEWAFDGLRPYLEVIPGDPSRGQGRSYRYLSSGRRFQVLASLESRDQDEYDEKIEKRGVFCGEFLCNFGLSNGDTPLDRDIKEYEDELQEKELEKLKKEGLE